MTPDELWEKYADMQHMQNLYMPKVNFLAALAEYGQAVRDRDAEIAGRIADSECYNIDERAAAKCCAAAIRKLKVR